MVVNSDELRRLQSHSIACIDVYCIPRFAVTTKTCVTVLLIPPRLSKNGAVQAQLLKGLSHARSCMLSGSEFDVGCILKSGVGAVIATGSQ